ncbi:hypothetical protein R6Q59_007455 [Mikania micrantha]
MRTGEKGMETFYLIVESMRNSQDDSLIFHLSGGLGASSILNCCQTKSFELGGVACNEMANMIFVDMRVGAGFSYIETQEGWVSSDTILSTHFKDFIKKFLIENPNFSKNPLYISGISYSDIIVPKVALELYEDNERGDQPTVNIQGYIICCPLTNKFMDFNSKLEYAHHMATISDDVYQPSQFGYSGSNMNVVITLQPIFPMENVSSS